MRSRFGPIWSEPQFEHEAIATFTLLFPTRGVGIRPEAAGITKNELVIVGHKDKIVVVSFFIADSKKKMLGRIPHFVLGRIPLQGRTLRVFAWKETQTDLLDKVWAALPCICQSVSEWELREDDYILNLHGFIAPNSAYMVAVPVRYVPAF